jgi:hypothetical protein
VPAVVLWLTAGEAAAARKDVVARSVAACWRWSAEYAAGAGLVVYKIIWARSRVSGCCRLATGCFRSLITERALVSVRAAVADEVIAYPKMPTKKTSGTKTSRVTLNSTDRRLSLMVTLPLRR